MSKITQKDSQMVSYMLKNKIVEYLPDVISAYQEEFSYRFNSKEITELMEIGEEIVNAHFPTSSYNFTLKKKEMEAFDDFVGDFVNAFIGVLISAMRAHMHVAQLSGRIDELPDQPA